MTIEETHKGGVDRTVLTLSTGGNEQDVKAMLELYGDMVETSDIHADPESARSGQKGNQKIGGLAQSDQKTTQVVQENPQSNQKSGRKIGVNTQKVIEKIGAYP